MKTETKHLLSWAAVPFMAVANGVVRDLTYGRGMGGTLAHSISVFPLVAAIFAWAIYVEKRRPLADRRAAVRVGAVWLALTVAFEAGLGALQGMSIRDMLASYDVTRGHLWPLVPLAMALAPEVARLWRIDSARRLRSATL
jgi:hypothetical protein